MGAPLYVNLRLDSFFLYMRGPLWNCPGEDRKPPNTIFIMPEKPAPAKKLSDKSTKQEMLEAYQTLAKQLEEKRAADLAPERRLEEKRTEEAVKVAMAVDPEGIDRDIGALKAEIGKMLADVSDRLAAESGKFRGVQKAVAGKERELQELYGIEKAAVSLAALIEAQNQKRAAFEIQMAQELPQAACSCRAPTALRSQRCRRIGTGSNYGRRRAGTALRY